jgi:hypothetical protein
LAGISSFNVECHKIDLVVFGDSFALVANYKIKIKEMALYVRKVQLSPAVRMDHVKALEKTSCKYPVRRVEAKVDNMNYVSFGIIFSRNGISFVLIHFSGTGVESHITSDVAIVFEVGL